MSERPIDRSTDSQVNLSAFVHYNNYIAWQFVYRFVEIIYCIYLSDCSLILYGVVLLCCCSCCCIYLWSIWTCSRSFIASSYCLRLAVLSTLVCLFVCRCHSHSNTHTHSLSFSLSLSDSFWAPLLFLFPLIALSRSQMTGCVSTYSWRRVCCKAVLKSAEYGSSYYWTVISDGALSSVRMYKICLCLCVCLYE